MYTSSSELKRRAKSRLRDRLMPILLIAAVYIVADTVINFFSSELSGYNAYSRRIMELVGTYTSQLQAALTPDAMEKVLDQIYAAMPSLSEFLAERGVVGPILSVLVSLIAMPLSAGYMHHILFESRNQDTNVGFLMHGFKMTFKTIAINVLSALAVGLGAMFFVIPGFIFSMMFSQAIFILLDDPDKGAVQCMRESARLMRGHKWRLFKLRFSFFFWYVAANIVVILLGVPLLNVYLTPYINLSAAVFYNELIRREPEGPEPIQF